jgi:hypothetical protein
MGSREQVRGILGCPVEGEIVDHGADHHAAAHEVADGVANVFVVPAEPIDPTDHEGVSSAQLVVETAAFGALGQIAAYLVCRSSIC